MAYLKKKAPLVPNNLDLPSGYGSDAAIVDVYAEQFADEEQVEVMAQISHLALDDPKDLRALAAWCEEVARYMEKYTR